MPDLKKNQRKLSKQNCYKQTAEISGEQKYTQKSNMEIVKGPEQLQLAI